MRKYYIKWGCCLLGAVGVMLQPSLAEPPAVAPSAVTTSSKKTNPQLDALLQQGTDALSSGDAKAACDATIVQSQKEFEAKLRNEEVS